tara:strand:- start:473 stop:688 length:216 start_codon:yes stop_codon:yes gene_type:complete
LVCFSFKIWGAIYGAITSAFNNKELNPLPSNEYCFYLIGHIVDRIKASIKLILKLSIGIVLAVCVKNVSSP